MSECRSDIRIRRASIDDWPAISAFIADAYKESAAYKGRARWQWQFLDNPHLGSEEHDSRVPVWIALDGDRVVGQIAVQAGRICYRGAPHQAGWIVDVMVLPEYRGLGLGHRIHALCAEAEPILVTLTMAAATRRIAERAGSVNLTPASQFAKLMKPKPDDIRDYLLERTKNRRKVHLATKFLVKCFLLHRLVHLGISPYLKLEALSRHRFVREREISFREVRHFGTEFDDLWARLSGEYEALFVRDSQFLNWRFGNAPDLVYRKFLVERNGAAVGYVILRLAGKGEPRMGTIVDLFVSRHDAAAIAEIIQFCLDEFGSDVAAVDCVTSISEIRDVLRSRGFWPIRKVKPTCVCQNHSIAENLMGASWFFSKADHDWDQVHLFTYISNNVKSR